VGLEAGGALTYPDAAVGRAVGGAAFSPKALAYGDFSPNAVKFAFVHTGKGENKGGITGAARIIGVYVSG
jgi:hypothetical protein